MRTSNRVLTAKEIRSLNLNEYDVMSYEYIYQHGEDNYYLLINGERVVTFTNSQDRKKSYFKIHRMGLAKGWEAPKLTDEEEGIIEAVKNGENPFAYTIMCANPKYNEIVK